MAPLSPLLRRGSSAIPPADGGGSGGGAPIDDYSPAAATAHGGGEACEHGRAEPPCDGDLDLEKGAAGSNNGLLRRQVSGGSGGGRDGSPFAAAAVGAAVASGHGTHRKPRGEKQKKAPLVSTYWLKIDFMGRDTMIRVDKHKLMHKLGVQARDLRLLDLTSATPPAILGRDKAIIVNLWYMKAIITLDYCLVVSPDSIADNEERQAVSAGQKFKSYVGLNSAAGYGSLQLPFELKVLEVCLDMTAAKLEQDSKKLEGDAYPDLDALSHKVNAINLERARRIKNWLVRRTRDVESVREVLERFLNDDGDMHRLHLTGAEMSRQVSMRPGDLSRLSAGLVSCDSSSDSSIDEAETAAVEMLLEAYFMQIDHTYNRLQNLDEYIKDTEDLVTIKLDQHRNQLITIDLLLTSFTVVLNLMTVVGGYFGMNLNSNLQEEPHLFKAVVLSTTLGGIALFVAFLIFLARQKLLVY
ncbi:Mg2+ transporter protein [Volvox carteri f. nagariensis]|uniref:Magnesium transporter n=1 Tax=Volvox carteri f. nagariensis TaxID=3068 RepID=D8TW89_VOLCA|nr:Mg2+ transporter protein [Volvox carteri f. nagariensis]EFJ48432.1 Mg2+ transporter protein [Volvox carteri f. nagariensis]|eukprot:XP_002950686.1 Mg2+ transporter protein [Volvox carteri f. nagariensis]